MNSMSGSVPIEGNKVRIASTLLLMLVLVLVLVIVIANTVSEENK